METNLSAESSQETLRNLDKSIRSNSVITPYLRSSLQECKVELNLAKLVERQKFYKNTEKKVKVIEGLIYVSRQLISVDSDLTNLPSAFLNFHDAYDLFCGFLDTKPGYLRFREAFRDYLLHPEFGLSVFIFEKKGSRFIILKNQTFDLSKCLIELETLESKEEKKRKNKLSQQFLHQAINTLDTEYDKNDIKGNFVLLSLHKRMLRTWNSD